MKCENIRHKCNLRPYKEELLQIRDGELGLPPGTGHHGEGRDAGGRWAGEFLMVMVTDGHADIAYRTGYHGDWSNAGGLRADELNQSFRNVCCRQ